MKASLQRGFFISKVGAWGSNPVWGAERSKRASVCRAARKAAQPPQRKERAQRAANPLTSTNNHESLATAGLFHAQGKHGVFSKGPPYRKTRPKGVGARPAGIIPSVMMKPLST